jgi:acyl dehydratase
MSGIVNTPLLGDPPDPDRRGGRYRGIHVFAAAFSWDFYQPVRPGDVVYAFQRLDDVEERETAFSGRSAFRTVRWVKMNQHAEILGVHRMLGLYAERKAAKDRGKYSGVELASYTDEDIAAIDAEYAREERRGRDPRCWEDVEVGEALSPLIKGPITITDVIRFHAGGYHLNDLRTSRLAWQNRLRKAAFYIKNEQGVPDVAQRVHWDADWARATGNPTTIDYGSMREYWLHHLLTDWVGDDGWVVSQRVEIRKFAYLGDLHRITGEVVAKRHVDRQYLVDIEMRATSQRDVATALGTATVVLPSRVGGPALLPEPDAALRSQAATMMRRHGELLREGVL